jgi:hypothetical protein
VDFGKLKAILDDHEVFLTEPGRWLARWARVVIRLRKTIRLALQDATLDSWREVKKVLEDSAPLNAGDVTEYWIPTSNLPSQILCDYAAYSSGDNYISFTSSRVISK